MPCERSSPDGRQSDTDSERISFRHWKIENGDSWIENSQFYHRNTTTYGKWLFSWKSVSHSKHMWPFSTRIVSFSYDDTIDTLHDT